MCAPHDFVPWSSFPDARFSSILKSPALLQPVPGEFYPWQQFHPLTCMLQLHPTGSITSMMFNMMPLPYHCFPQPSSLLTALLLVLLRIPQRPLFLCFPLTSDILHAHLPFQLCILLLSLSNLIHTHVPAGEWLPIFFPATISALSLRPYSQLSTKHCHLDIPKASHHPHAHK